METKYDKVFQYQILRFIRNVTSGEFVNVAVIIYELETKNLYTKRITDKERLTNFFPNIDDDMIMDVIDSIVKNLEKGNFSISQLEELTKNITNKGNSTFIFSEVRRGITDNMMKSLNYLFAEMITKYNK